MSIYDTAEWEEANSLIQHMVVDGELNADSDAAEIRQALCSFSKEFQEAFVVDMGRSNLD